MKELMLGNDAVARGLYEAGCAVASSYPGTPSTEITEAAATYEEIYCEWAPNEKVAMEEMCIRDSVWSDCVARLCTAVGATDEDIVQISFGYGLFTGALGLHYGLEKIGATVVPASSGNTQKQVMLLKDFGVTALVSTRCV